jgi:UDP-3-O-[3-hydroxymyristoyl] N-acetylglucosamine deacetylase
MSQVTKFLAYQEWLITIDQLSIDFAQKSYLKEISRARTFGYVKDMKTLQEKNLALGASMDNAIALSDDDVLLL